MDSDNMLIPHQENILIKVRIGYIVTYYRDTQVIIEREKIERNIKRKERGRERERSRKREERKYTSYCIIILKFKKIFVLF